MIPGGLIFPWLIAGAAIIALRNAPVTRRTQVWAGVGFTLAATLWCLAAIRGVPTTAFTRWSTGFVFDDLSALLLPPVWLAGLVITCVTLLRQQDPRPSVFTAVATGLCTAGVLSASALLTLAAVEVGALLTMLALFLESEQKDGLLRVATILKFLTMSVAGSATLFLALILTNFYAFNADRIELPRIIISLLVIGFGITVAAVPFYFYLPDVFDVAQPGVSAALAGPLQVMAFVYLIRTVESAPWLLSDDHVVDVLVAGGLIGACLAAILALGQAKMARMLSFSTMAEAGWLTFAMGSALTAGWAGALSLLYVRCLAKPIQLLCTAETPVEIKPTTVPQLSSSPAGIAAWCLAGAALIGLPATAGFWASRDLFQASWSRGLFPTLLLLISVLLTVAAYARPLLRRLKQGRPQTFRLRLADGLLALCGVLLFAFGLFPAAFQPAVSRITSMLLFLR